jgi:hypothetical protein
VSINLAQFPQPRLPLQGDDLVVGYQLIGSVPTLAQYTLTQMFVGVFPGGIVPIPLGGTGATTAPQALTNLGAASLLSNTFAGNQSVVVPNATLNIDDSNGGSSANINFKSQGIPQWEIRSVAFNAFFLDRFVGGVFVNSPISVDQTSGTVNLSQVSITGGSINGTTVGAATPSSGAFTTVTASGLITPAQLAGIKGTTTNNNANAGSVGEYLTNTTSGTPLATNTPANATSVSLTAGDWDVQAVIRMNPAAATVNAGYTVGVSTTSATVGGLGTAFQLVASIAANSPEIGVSPVVRVSIAGTATAFAVVSCGFVGGTMTADGFIRARRVR